MREAAIAAYAVLREGEEHQQWPLIAADSVRLLAASTASIYELGERGLRRRSNEAELALPVDAFDLEVELVARAFSAGKSLISNHPQIDERLQPLAQRCAEQGFLCHALLVRAHGRQHGALAVHWLGRERPPYERRAGFYAYWDTVGLALAAARERSRIEVELNALREFAYRDRLTGLPNALALEEELRRQERTEPLSVLALDFDGMREANAVFASYEAGGDVLIRTVGRALPALVGADAFPSRLHTAGDEFAVLLPAAGAEAAAQRARALEVCLDGLDVPASHRAVYRGASVGWATRTADETVGQTLGRAIEVMRRRKVERRR